VRRNADQRPVDCAARPVARAITTERAAPMRATMRIYSCRNHADPLHPAGPRIRLGPVGPGWAHWFVGIEATLSHACGQARERM
jgi:hypothetical protein